MPPPTKEAKPVVDRRSGLVAQLASQYPTRLASGERKMSPVPIVCLTYRRTRLAPMAWGRVHVMRYINDPTIDRSSRSSTSGVVYPWHVVIPKRASILRAYASCVKEE
ncbi:hypothetical protein AeRB84_009229 [Aphanomyces euteiches]|nr:hypothetical protein AeRB84_009229 [Aphanomyces euteiches]